MRRILLATSLHSCSLRQLSRSPQRTRSTASPAVMVVRSELAEVAAGRLPDRAAAADSRAGARPFEAVADSASAAANGAAAEIAGPADTMAGGIFVTRPG